MLAPEIHPFGRTRSNLSRSSFPAALILASDFGFCFQCQASSRIVSRRPIEITALTGHADLVALVVIERLPAAGAHFPLTGANIADI
jgi:hypothetical protein